MRSNHRADNTGQGRPSLPLCHYNSSHSFLPVQHKSLVVTMAGDQAWVSRFNSQLDPHAGLPGHHINVRRCGGLLMALLQLKKLGTTLEEKRISSQFQVSVSSRYDLSCWKQRKKNIPYFATQAIEDTIPKCTRWTSLGQFLFSVTVLLQVELYLKDIWKGVIKTNNNNFQSNICKNSSYSSRLHDLILDVELCQAKSFIQMEKSRIEIPVMNEKCLYSSNGMGKIQEYKVTIGHSLLWEINAISWFNDGLCLQIYHIYDP